MRITRRNEDAFEWRRNNIEWSSARSGYDRNSRRHRFEKHNPEWLFVRRHDQDVDSCEKFLLRDKPRKFDRQAGRALLQSSGVRCVTFTGDQQAKAVTEYARGFDGIVMALVRRDLPEQADRDRLMQRVRTICEPFHVHPVRNDRRMPRFEGRESFQNLRCRRDPRIHAPVEEMTPDGKKQMPGEYDLRPGQSPRGGSYQC